MARFSFAGELYGGVAVPDAGNLGAGDVPNSGDDPAGALVVGAEVALAFFDAEAGTELDDFLLWNNVTADYDIPATEVTTTVDGYAPRFQGPDGIEELWYLAGTTWLRLRSYDITGGLTSVAAGDITDIDLVGIDLITAVDAAAARAAIGAFASSEVSSYVDTNILDKATLVDLQTELEIDDTTLDTRIDAWADASSHPPVIVIGSTDALPTVVNGAVLLILSGAASGALSVSSVIAEAIAGSTSATTSGTPSALGAGAVCFAAVSTYQAGASSGSPAAQPTGLTGMGLTWTEVTLPVHESANGLNSLKLFKGVGTGTATKPVAAYDSAPTGTHIRIVQVVNATGTVAQATSTQVNASVGTPTVSLASPPSGTGVVLCWIVQNNNTNTQTAGTGYTEVGTAVTSTGMRTSGEAAVPGTSQTASWTTPTSPTPYQKLLAILEVS